ncbi:MAG: ATP-binding protein [Eubacteriales bacterium]|jgi:signal transduction histidine kinase
MKELSLYILDITQNSLAANAENIEISVEETPDRLKVTISDDGRGMDSETLSKVENPFFTTRTTRKIGLGVPLFKQAALQTGGTFLIQSVSEAENPSCHGTKVEAVFHKTSFDFVPLGDIISTLITLVMGLGDANLVFTHTTPGRVVELDTNILRKALGTVPLSNTEVMTWIRDYLKEQYLN